MNRDALIRTVAKKPPVLRVLRAATWGFSLGEARYYGWRWFSHIGPFIVLCWPTLSDEDR